MWGDGLHRCLSGLPPPGSREGTLRLPWAWAISSSCWSPSAAGPLGAVLGNGSISAGQAKDLTTLVGTLCVAHLQGHGGIITFVCPQLCVLNVPPSPWSCHAHLAGTLVCAHLEADGRVVHGGQDMVLGLYRCRLVP